MCVCGNERKVAAGVDSETARCSMHALSLLRFSQLKKGITAAAAWRPREWMETVLQRVQKACAHVKTRSVIYKSVFSLVLCASEPPKC
jgi:hypothetical protein